MTKVLVTGATSRQTNPMKNSRDAMVSWLIAEVCRDLGYEVEHRDPSILDELTDFDHVFCAIAPLHALGANRIYGALAAMLRAWGDNKLTMYLDDVDSAKIVNGIKTMVNDPYRFTKPFFVYRKEYELAKSEPWHSWLMSGVETLANYAWPKTLVPAFTWAEHDRLLKATPNITDAVFFDPTAYLPNYATAEHEGRELRWVTESNNDKWLAQQRTEWPMIRYGKGYQKRPLDEQLVLTYSQSVGVLDEGIPHGWWHSRLPFAMHAGALYVTRWQHVQELDEPFSYLPDAIEGMSGDGQYALAQAQQQMFEKHTSSKEELKQQIREVVER